MKYSKFILAAAAIFGLSFSVGAQTATAKNDAMISEEISSLDNLIEVTRENLENQQKVREMILQYQKASDQFLTDPDNIELLFATIKSAHQLLEGIKNFGLTQTFSPDFIGELNMFSQMASKRGIPKP